MRSILVFLYGYSPPVLYAKALLLTELFAKNAVTFLPLPLPFAKVAEIRLALKEKIVAIAKNKKEFF